MEELLPAVLHLRTLKSPIGNTAQQWRRIIKAQDPSSYIQITLQLHISANPCNDLSSPSVLIFGQEKNLEEAEVTLSIFFITRVSQSNIDSIIKKLKLEIS